MAALATGEVRPEGIDLNILPMPVEETFWRMMRHQEFDVSELSFGSFLVARDRGHPAFTAIPVFPSRSFRHSGIFVHAQSGIREPRDLIGRRVGLPEWQLTACIWIRGHLQHEYGVPLTSIEWLTGGEEEPGRVEKAPIELPPDIRITPIGPEQTLNSMLEAGQIDAFIGPRAPSAFLKGSPHVRRLFPDHVAEEKAYYKKTGIFPIMHVVAIRDEVLERHPWIARNLQKAFVEAKERIYQGFEQTAALKVTLPWLQEELARTRELMGRDFWPYGLEANRPAIEALVSYAHEQGLIRRRPAVEELFAPSALEEYRL